MYLTTPLGIEMYIISGRHCSILCIAVGVHMDVGSILLPQIQPDVRVPVVGVDVRHVSGLQLDAVCARLHAGSSPHHARRHPRAGTSSRHPYHFLHCSLHTFKRDKL